jgi:hypothetical protein
MLHRGSSSGVGVRLKSSWKLRLARDSVEVIQRVKGSFNADSDWVRQMRIAGGNWRP